MEMNWIIWMILGLCAFITLMGGLMCLSDDWEAKQAGQKLLAGWWSAVAIISITTAAMTFVVKPFLAWFFGLF